MSWHTLQWNPTIINLGDVSIFTEPPYNNKAV